jgi:hypothetical protein
MAGSENGIVWVGWDTYVRGNYDVLVRSFAGGDAGPVRAITRRRGLKHTLHWRATSRAAFGLRSTRQTGRITMARSNRWWRSTREHRVAYEHEGGPKGATAERLYAQRSGYRPAGFIGNAWAKVLVGSDYRHQSRRSGGCHA